ncbi:MAG: hypothetical protein AAB421_02420 [Patescibacteria group bacterium]
MRHIENFLVLVRDATLIVHAANEGGYSTPQRHQFRVILETKLLPDLLSRCELTKETLSQGIAALDAYLGSISVPSDSRTNAGWSDSELDAFAVRAFFGDAGFGTLSCSFVGSARRVNFFECTLTKPPMSNPPTLYHATGQSVFECVESVMKEAAKCVSRSILLNKSQGSNRCKKE